MGHCNAGWAPSKHLQSTSTPLLATGARVAERSIVTTDQGSRLILARHLCHQLGNLHQYGVGACLPDDRICGLQRVFALPCVSPASCHGWIVALARRMAGQGVRLLEHGVSLASPRFHCVGATLPEAPVGGRALQGSPGSSLSYVHPPPMPGGP